jgi:DeoR/GlpR family transcriptional regulator of sugar metabolism
MSVRPLTTGTDGVCDGAVRYTDAPARREELLRRLARDGYVSSQHVAAELGVSEMTIRRDLSRLHDEGLARRVVGGASVTSPVLAAPPFDQRSHTGAAEKRAIAEACAAHLAGTATIALDAGSTVAALAPVLAPGCAVVTHSVPVMTACASRGDVDLIGLGGAYQPATRSFAGPATRAGLADLAVDVAVLSATGVDAGGAYSASALDAEVKRELRRCARRVVLLADHTKLGLTAPIRFATLADVDVVVTDEGARPDQLAELRAAGPEVVVAAVRGRGNGWPA